MAAQAAPPKLSEAARLPGRGGGQQGGVRGGNTAKGGLSKAAQGRGGGQCQGAERRRRGGVGPKGRATGGGTRRREEHSAKASPAWASAQRVTPRRAYPGAAAPLSNRRGRARASPRAEAGPAARRRPGAGGVASRGAITRPGAAYQKNTTTDNTPNITRRGSPAAGGRRDSARPTGGRAAQVGC